MEGQGKPIMIRLAELYEATQKIYEMKLIAGDGGLHQMIQWVHMIENEQAAAFLRGNELVFTTGIGYSDAAWLTRFAQGLHENHASGLVVNVGPYIQEIPAATIDYCRQVSFPLFTVPWHVRLVDITRNFCRRIIHNEQIEMTVSSAFQNAIFWPRDTVKYQAQLSRYGFDPEGRYSLVAFTLACQDEKRDEELAAFQLNVEKRISVFGKKYSVFVHEHDLLLVLADFTEDEIETGIVESVNNFCTTGGYRLQAGVGQNELGLALLAKSYREARAALNMAVKTEQNILYYKNLGVLKILLSTEDKKVLQDFYQEALGRLADYDATYHTDYLVTLRLYLEQNGSVQAVAKQTYVHRNTINYKLRKIKEITGRNLADVEERLTMLLAFKIKEIL